jgi:anti-sigma factor ChrR (cupin superfamily)
MESKAKSEVRMMSIWRRIMEGPANSKIGVPGLENVGVILVGIVPCKLLPEADEHSHRGE